MNRLLKQWKKLSPAKKASLAIVFAKLCERGLSMISTPLFTRMMIPEQYGVVTNFISWEQIIIIIATLNLSLGVFNNGMLEFKEDRDKFSASCLVLANTCTLLTFCVYFLLKKHLSGIVDLTDSLMILMFAYMLFYPSYSYWSARQRYEFKYKLLTVLTIGISFLQLGLGIVAVFFAPVQQQAVAKTFAMQGVTILVGIIMYIIVLLKTRFSISWKYILYAFRFNIFLVPHFLAMSVLASGDRVMINSMVGKTETAIYGVSYSAAWIITIFWQAIAASWIPWVYENLKSNKINVIKKRGNQVLIIFATISLLCMLFAPEIMKILAAPEYMEGIYVIPPVTAGVFFVVVYALYMRLEYYSKKTKATMVSSIFAALLNLILNYVFIKKYGYIAAGYTTLLCYVLLALFHYIYTRIIQMKDIYDDRFTLIISLVIICASIFIGFTYYSAMMRYVIISLLLLVVVFKRRIVINQLNSILR